MKFPFRTTLATLMLGLVALAASAPLQGCLGKTARQNVGVPALLLADDGVVANATSGIALLPVDQQPTAQTELTAFQNAIAGKDRAVILSDALPRWPLVRALATAGISGRVSSGQITSGVAGSLLERLNQFESVLMKVGTN